MVTEEYLSLTTLVGDVLGVLEGRKNDHAAPIGVLVPQNEGTETDGQYGRLMRTLLDENGLDHITIVAPFLEDIIKGDGGIFRDVILTALAGDVLLAMDMKERDACLGDMIRSIKTGSFDLDVIKKIARGIDSSNPRNGKRIMAVGELPILYNRALNDGTFDLLEREGYWVTYASLSEALWMMWNDHLNNNKSGNSGIISARLEILKNAILAISCELGKATPFEKNLKDMAANADGAVGLFAGGNGRYRRAKIGSRLPGIAGVITVSSTYENTGIATDMLIRSYESDGTRPVLNMTFDGNHNENDHTRVGSFLYLIQ
jgi:predicted nucleotide-binding protein (sugar kinase/HSP70/actin superfamily)